MSVGQHNEIRIRACSKQKWKTKRLGGAGWLGGRSQERQWEKERKKERTNKRREEEKNLMRSKKKGGKEGREIERCA